VSIRPSPIVYVPQLPARYDAALQLWVPSINIAPAEHWGATVMLFDQNASRAPTEALLPMMRERMAGFRARDFVCCVGDPALIAAATVYAVQSIVGHDDVGPLRLLKWDRQARLYIQVEIHL